MDTLSAYRSIIQRALEEYAQTPYAYGEEMGIAATLVEAGIPKDHIVLAFRSTELRQHTGFAVA